MPIKAPSATPEEIEMTTSLQERFPTMYTPEGLEMMKSRLSLRNPDGSPVSELAATYIEWMKAKNLHLADWEVLDDLQEDPLEEEEEEYIDADSVASVTPTLDDISEILKEL